MMTTRRLVRETATRGGGGYGYCGGSSHGGGGGKEMVMERRWLWRMDSEVDGGVVTPTVVAAAIGVDGGDSSWGDGGVQWWWRPYEGG
nr:hypothetical protein [Tanacetum cinerariifolium]